MSDSVYAALCRQDFGNTSILFLKRTNGDWWLPGGKFSVDEESPRQAVRRWVSDLLTIYHRQLDNIGMWQLSPEVGGGKVYLFEGFLEYPSNVAIRNKDSGLSEKIAFFNRHEIWSHLYVHGDIPWGQAKMAVYRLGNLFADSQRHAHGELLKDDLGEVVAYNWMRPPDSPK